jgi:hypothetical protein
LCRSRRRRPVRSRICGGLAVCVTRA